MISPRRHVAAALLLTAASGAVDLVAVVLLGGAFAGVVTGNLVTLGHGLVDLDPRLIVPVVVAVGGFSVGVTVWARAWRRGPDALVGPVAAELAVLLAALAWGLATDRRPEPVVLGLVSVALGGQSVVSLRLKASTTYMTGTLTTGLHDLAARGLRAAGGAVAVAGCRLVALIGGAVAAALLLDLPRQAVLALPVVLVAVCLLVVRTPAYRPATEP
jgi:uncharacterized membrane protein YoaK (UPF0700 family)